MGASASGLPHPPCHSHPSSHQPSDILSSQSCCEQRSPRQRLHAGALSPDPTGGLLSRASLLGAQRALLRATHAVWAPCCAGQGGQGGGQPGSLGTKVRLCTGPPKAQLVGTSGSWGLRWPGLEGVQRPILTFHLPPLRLRQEGWAGPAPPPTCGLGHAQVVLASGLPAQAMPMPIGKSPQVNKPRIYAIKPSSGSASPHLRFNGGHFWSIYNQLHLSPPGGNINHPFMCFDRTTPFSRRSELTVCFPQKWDGGYTRKLPPRSTVKAHLGPRGGPK